MTLTPECSPTIAALAKALCIAQGKLRNVHKDTANPFFKSRYANLPDILDVVRPVLAEHGLCLVQQPHETEAGPAIRTMLMHQSGEFMASTLLIRAIKSDPQGVGSAITYARRYGVQSILNIAGTDEDDDGNEGSGQPTQQQSKPQPVKHQSPSVTPPVDTALLRRELDRTGWAWKEAVWTMNSNDGTEYVDTMQPKDMDQQQLSGFLAWLTKQPNKAPLTGEHATQSDIPY